MTREEAITYGERKKASIQEKLCRDGSSYGDYSIYYSEMEFTSAALSALREQEKRRVGLLGLEHVAAITTYRRKK